MSTAKRGLGRGLDALLPARAPAAKPPPPPAKPQKDGSVFQCPIEKIAPQEGQPRHHFDTEKLDELAQSIREHGLIEPLVVRRTKTSDVFELIAGERRWRACQRAGVLEVPVVVRDVSPKEAFELALIENIQREDLNAIEFAQALDRLLEDHGYSQEQLADRVGKDRSTIANALRLLKLPEKIREMVVSGQLSEGHGRALLGAPDKRTMSTVAEKVIRGKLSVRQTEALIRGQKGAGAKGGSGAAKGKSASVRDLEERLARRLGAKVEVKDKSGKGEIAIRYSSLDELDRLLDLLL